MKVSLKAPKARHLVATAVRASNCDVPTQTLPAAWFASWRAPVSNLGRTLRKVPPRFRPVGKRHYRITTVKTIVIMRYGDDSPFPKKKEPRRHKHQGYTAAALHFVLQEQLQVQRRSTSGLCLCMLTVCAISHSMQLARAFSLQSGSLPPLSVFKKR